MNLSFITESHTPDYAMSVGVLVASVVVFLLLSRSIDHSKTMTPKRTFLVMGTAIVLAAITESLVVANADAFVPTFAVFGLLAVMVHAPQENIECDDHDHWGVDTHDEWH